MENVFISIVIPCYNSFSKMTNCINSLKEQKSENFEVIFVDDCSIDGTFDLLTDYLKSCRFKYKIIKNHQNLGPGSSRNYGIKESKGNYLMFMDSDDYIRSDSIQVVTNIIKNKKTDLLVFDYVYVIGKNNYKKESILYGKEGFLSNYSAFSYSNGSVWGKIYSKDLIIKNKIFFPSLNRSEDIPFIKLSLAVAENIYYSKELLYFYEKNTSSLMHNNELLDETNALKSYEIVKERLDELGLTVYIKRFFLLYVMYSVVQTKVILKKKRKEINDFINKYYFIYPEWKLWVDEFEFPKIQKIFLKLIANKRIRTIKIMVKIRSVTKK